jgi:hypothetical protein
MSVQMRLAKAIAKIYLGYTLSAMLAGLLSVIAVYFVSSGAGPSSWEFTRMTLMTAAVILFFALPVAIPSVVVLMTLGRKSYLEYAALGGVCPIFTLAWFNGHYEIWELFSLAGLGLFLIGAVSAYPIWATCTGRWRIF